MKILTDIIKIIDSHIELDKNKKRQIKKELKAYLIIYEEFLSLSELEVERLQALRYGKVDKLRRWEIAEQCGIPYKTFENQITRLNAKFGTKKVYDLIERFKEFL